MTAIVGISAYYHDSAVALIQDGRIVGAAQEERFTRQKHDAAFPLHALDAVLADASLTLADVDAVAFYDKPFLKFERLLETYATVAPVGVRSFATSMPVWLREKLFQRGAMADALRTRDPGFDANTRLLFAEHHMSHAASAFYPSPFEEAVVLTVDGVGEWATTAVSLGRGRDLRIARELHFPHSLGLLYSAFTYFLGFKVNSGEYKVMGLAPYGAPRFADTIRAHLIDVKPDGTFRLNQSYFDYSTGLTMTNRRFAALFGLPARQPDREALTQIHLDLAASVQAVTDDIMLRLTRALAREYRMPNLCLAGGVALNCVANGKILRDGAFEHIWIQPAAGDAGGAIGAALAAWHLELGNDRTPVHGDAMQGALLGPSYSQSDIERRLRAMGAIFETVSDREIVDRTARALADGQAVGWFQGRMEFGPRALGARSILADPRARQMQRTLNMKVKFRESFRPFAPSVLREDASAWFSLDSDSPYMLLVADVAASHRVELSANEQAAEGLARLDVARSVIPAVTHVDYSARVQTVDGLTNPRYHALISRFKERTGCPVLVNTSFNVRGEPIVCTPEDAYRCFMSTDLDVLSCGNAFLRKTDQPVLKDARPRGALALD